VKVDLKNVQVKKIKMVALNYTIDFVKTCNLEMLYLVFGNEVSLRHLNLFFQMHYLHTFMMQLLFILMKFTFYDVN
jgi:hypothetical protein